MNDRCKRRGRRRRRGTCGTMTNVSTRAHRWLAIIGLAACSFEADGLGSTGSSTADTIASTGTGTGTIASTGTGTASTGTSTSTSAGPTSGTTTSGSGDHSSSEPSATTVEQADISTSCPQPDCRPGGQPCPGEQRCHPMILVCMEPCSPICDFYCIDDWNQYDPNGLCPWCDTGATPLTPPLESL